MPGDGAVMKRSVNLPSDIRLKRASSSLIGPMSRYFSSPWHSGAFCCLLTCGKRRTIVSTSSGNSSNSRPRRRLETPPKPDMRRGT